MKAAKISRKRPSEEKLGLKKFKLVAFTNKFNNKYFICLFYFKVLRMCSDPTPVESQNFSMNEILCHLKSLVNLFVILHDIFCAILYSTLFSTKSQAEHFIWFHCKRDPLTFERKCLKFSENH